MFSWILMRVSFRDSIKKKKANGVSSHCTVIYFIKIYFGLALTNDLKGKII